MEELKVAHITSYILPGSCLLVGAMTSSLFDSFSPTDLPVGAEPGAVPHGPVPLPLLPLQSAGRGAAQPQEAAGLRLPAHQAGHGTPGHLLRLLLPRAGEYRPSTPPHPLSPSSGHWFSLAAGLLCAP